MGKEQNNKKVVVRLTGGLGNQLHQYSYGLVIANKLNAKIYIDKEFLEVYSKKLNVTFRNIAINKFEIEYEIYKSVLSKHIILNVIKRIKLVQLIISIFKTKILYQRENIDELELNKYNLIYLDGVIGSYSDYKNNITNLKNTLKISSNFNNISDYINNIIPEKNSVSIHIRRTDYLKKDSIHEVLEISYYIKAINYIKSKIDNPKFYVFSDDKEFIENFFTTEDIKILNHSFDDKDIFDFLAISRCQHNIIANSTFSWWAAFLKTSNEGIIIAPSKNLKNLNLNIKDNYPFEWIIY
jgi:hypothetical protein